MTKTERERRKIALMLVKFLAKFESYDGDVVDILDEANDILHSSISLNGSISQRVEAENLIKQLKEYFQP